MSEGQQGRDELAAECLGQPHREIHSETDQEIGAGMRAARERAGLSLADVATRSGHSAARLEALELGVGCWSGDDLSELAPAYGVGVVDAFILAGLLSEDDLRAWRAES